MKEKLQKKIQKGIDLNLRIIGVNTDKIIIDEEEKDMNF